LISFNCSLLLSSFLSIFTLQYFANRALSAHQEEQVMATTTVSTRFIVISDTHAFDFTQPQGPFRLPVAKADVLLHCGDLTYYGGLPAFRQCLKMLGAIDAELKLVIPGNHDLELDKEYWRTHLDNMNDDELIAHEKSVEIMQGELAKEAGVTYLEEGTHTFTLSTGAKFTIYVSPYSPEFCGWAFGYKHNEDRFNSCSEVEEGVTSIARNPIPDFPNVDIVMTHGPPKGILDLCPTGNAGCKNLLRAAARAKPLMYCFGHVHEGHGAELVTWKEQKNETDSASQSVQNASSQLNWFPWKKHENEAKTSTELIQMTSSQANRYPQPSNLSIKRGEQTLMVNAAIKTGDNKAVNAPWLIDIDLPCDASS
jgi:Icc-related predicted phosphoesterase